MYKGFIAFVPRSEAQEWLGSDTASPLPDDELKLIFKTHAGSESMWSNSRRPMRGDNRLHVERSGFEFFAFTDCGVSPTGDQDRLIFVYLRKTESELRFGNDLDAYGSPSVIMFEIGDTTMLDLIGGNFRDL